MNKTKSKKPSRIKQIVKKVADDQAKAAQKNMLEEAFYDLYPNRWEVYKVNFFRGLSFGFGSAIGATVLVVVSIMILNLFVNIPGGIGEIIQDIINAMNDTI
ncbi:MAG: hypothetical protein KIG14_00400 [Candidatus Sacchiramonaceae bacterium]|jgi:hypothetical protein|nr:hypothetical protein [Candidatus Saccharimonadaceae bacterium]